MQFARVSKTTADWLAEAAAYIEQNGWWKGALQGPNRRQVCAVGAILYSQGLTEADINNGPDSDRIHQVCAALLRAVPEQDPGLWSEVGAVTDWNDRTVTSKQEVLDAFRKAEKIERAGFDPDAGKEIA